MASTHQQTYNAGRHLAVAEALLHGSTATLVGQASYIEVNGPPAQVQVAAKGAWQIENVDKYTSATIERIVLVNITGGLREFYVCPGDSLRSDVRERYDEFVSSKGSSRPRNPDSRHAVIYPQQVRKWCDGWRRFA